MTDQEDAPLFDPLTYMHGPEGHGREKSLDSTLWNEGNVSSRVELMYLSHTHDSKPLNSSPDDVLFARVPIAPGSRR